MTELARAFEFRRLDGHHATGSMGKRWRENNDLVGEFCAVNDHEAREAAPGARDDGDRAELAERIDERPLDDEPAIRQSVAATSLGIGRRCAERQAEDSAAQDEQPPP